MADTNIKWMEANPLLITSLFNADYKKKKKLYPLPERKGGVSDQDETISWVGHHVVKNNLRPMSQKPTNEMKL